MGPRAVSDIGLTIVYELVGETPVADIVFVHGLQGHPQTTWSRPSRRPPAGISSETDSWKSRTTRLPGRKQDKHKSLTFREALPMTGVNLGLLNDRVVLKQSSLLGDPREHAETIEANHKNMCRFYGMDDPGYKQVSGELKDLVKGVQPSIQSTKQPYTDVSEAEVQGKVTYHSSSSGC
ncbi:hypothetical protein, variant [Exophiala sideris]|uniref:DUF676 domain-containing protein n=1 Tax=Exophiala sideris TaxID=1016849 RepID=A0A0D1X218_9EURO|nr:hypothetical protein, variant [Exophiala sideris]